MTYDPHVEELAQAIAHELEVSWVTLSQIERDRYRRAAEVAWAKAEETLSEFEPW